MALSKDDQSLVIKGLGCLAHGSSDAISDVKPLSCGVQGCSALMSVNKHDRATKMMELKKAYDYPVYESGRSMVRAKDVPDDQVEADREYTFMHRLSGVPGIARVFSRKACGRIHVQVMQVAGKVTLFDCIEADHTKLKKKMPQRTAKQLRDRAKLCITRRAQEQLIDAVEAMHLAGIAHCDLHDENIMIGEDGTPMLIDFGLAMQRSDVQTEQEWHLLCLADWMMLGLIPTVVLAMNKYFGKTKQLETRMIKALNEALGRKQNGSVFDPRSVPEQWLTNLGAMLHKHAASAMVRRLVMRAPYMARWYPIKDVEQAEDVWDMMTLNQYT